MSDADLRLFDDDNGGLRSLTASVEWYGHKGADVRPRSRASIVVGRNGAGVAYAHLVEGSVVVLTRRSVTLGGAARRVQRQVRRRYGAPVRVFYLGRALRTLSCGDYVVGHAGLWRGNVPPPEIVTLCGSTRFKNAFLAEQARLTLEGRLVISVGMFGQTDYPEYDWTTGGTELKRMLDELHKRKIDLADRVHVINVGGYVGESTRDEIRYAEERGLPITYLESR